MARHLLTAGLLSLIVCLAAACNYELAAGEPDAGTADAAATDGGGPGKDGKAVTDTKATGQDSKVPGPDQKAAKPDQKLPKPDLKATPDKSPPKLDKGPPPNPRWTLVGGAVPSGSDSSVTVLANGDVLVAGGEKSGGGGGTTYFKAAYRFVAKTSTFVAAGNMMSTRSNHTGTLLADGRVLVCGGRTAKTYLNKCELFDPKKPPASAWSAAASLPASRWDHAAVRLANGAVLLSGGFGYSDSMPSLTLYMPKTGSWVTPAAQLKQKRRNHTTTLLPGGDVLVAGGLTGTSFGNYKSLRSMEIYDPKAGTVKLLKTLMTEARNAHTATLLKSGVVMITGGICWSGCTKKAMNDLYDPKTQTVTSVAHPGGVLPAGHVAGLIKDGRLLVAGNNAASVAKAVHAYDPVKKTWATLPSMKFPRVVPEGAGLPDGRVLIVGGVKSTSPYQYNTTAEIFSL